VYVVILFLSLPFTAHAPSEIRNYLTSIVGIRSQYPLKRPIFSSNVAVQTESATSQFSSQPHRLYGQTKMEISDQESTLTAADLASILQWSKDISSDINLSSGMLYINYTRLST